jgi:hypothetical protein
LENGIRGERFVYKNIRPSPHPSPNSAIEWSFLRRRRWHTAEKLYLQNGEGPLFRVPLAEPGGTLGLPFGSFAFRWRSQRERSVCLSDPSPLQGIGPRSLTPPLAHSSPGSSPGPNAPNPLAGDRPVMPAMKIHGDLHCPFAFHRGIGVCPTGWTTGGEGLTMNRYGASSRSADDIVPDGTGDGR